uniref:ethanolamine ammonia-lyase subunit EutC n=1 Tax=Halomonas sp. TaxID=1486246 RepID=UPI00260A3F51|nr:ethanolamine ammonia-lyase subunit EutC [Halomonas sp.]
MSTDKPSRPVTDNPWHLLRRFTDARIGLGRAGVSLPTSRSLEFQLAHAQAQDAVHLPLDVDDLCLQFEAESSLSSVMSTQRLPIQRLHSQASDRQTYLQRPDWGRRLDEASREQLKRATDVPQASYDLAIVVVDGLSSFAVQHNAVPFLRALSDGLDNDDHHWSLAPLTVVEQGRVAIGDEVGEMLNASAVLVLIGERPGLSSPDSLGLYLTWGPRIGLTDAYRNCISNVRPAGLAFSEASRRLVYLLRESRKLGLSGVKLKDRTQDDVIETSESPGNFLTS